MHAEPGTWPFYFLQVAFCVAQRASCDRRHVGAVLVQQKRVIATGYNGSPPGEPHCDDDGHDLVPIDGRMSCQRTVHAEQNALFWAARYGVSTEGATMYVTDQPCRNCLKALLSAGVREVIYARHYPGSDPNWTSERLRVVHMPVDLQAIAQLVIDGQPAPTESSHEPVRTAVGTVAVPDPSRNAQPNIWPSSKRDIHEGLARAAGHCSAHQPQPAHPPTIDAPAVGDWEVDLCLARLEVQAHRDDTPSVVAERLLELAHPAAIAQALILLAAKHAGGSGSGSSDPAGS